ncbi:YceI family protein [Prolixibacteraceae bacterium Z1-6]|uniref:YceI family protein n=1 Tax=Draconibacterium aestuarii TaxID=2998507 RepID=A0A9X3F4Q9_9BACT|nr:YceI family protein [Prolixibacteraceae bacterium Z1-6]
MKKLTGILVAIVIALTAVANDGNGKKSFDVDTKASKVYWTGKKVTGEHTGYLAVKSGTVLVEGGKVLNADVNLDLSTIECTDLTGEWKDKLVGHLKSDDFFSVEKHPNATFKITAVKDAGDKNTVVGDLTIKGITHEISFPADVKVAGETLTAIGTASIDRTKWNIKYNSGKFFDSLGDKMIYDEFEIKFELTAVAGETLSLK